LDGDDSALGVPLHRFPLCGVGASAPLNPKAVGRAVLAITLSVSIFWVADRFNCLLPDGRSYALQFV